MTAFSSTQAGNWSAQATWGSVGAVPGDGDTAQVNHAVTVDVNTTVGLSNTLAQAGTGTIAISTTTVTGTSTAFTTQLKGGDVIVTGTTIRTVLAITDNTHLTIGANATVGAGASFTFNPHSVWINGAAGVLTVATGVTFIVRGDLNVTNSTFTLAAGSHYRFDSSLASGTPVYSINLTAGEHGEYVGTLLASGTSGSHCAIDIAASSGVGQIKCPFRGGNGAGASIALNYTDCTSIGSASVDGVYLLPIASAQQFKFNHCTFTNCGRLYTTGYDSVHAAADVILTGNQWLSVPADPQDIVQVDTYSATTGARTVTDNVMALPDKDCHLILNNSIHGYTVQRNVFGRVDTEPPTGLFTSFDTNFFYIRHLGATTLWSFVGNGGDTLSNCYVINDEGPAQANQHALMANDTPSQTGTWTLSYEVFERSGIPTAGQDRNDVTHIGAPSVAFTMRCDHCLVLPMSNGWSSGRIRGRGNANATYEATHCTLMIDPQSSGLVNDGGFIMGDTYAGFTGMVADFRSNLGWSKTVSAGGARGGFTAAYTNPSPVANLLTAANVDYNAHYNALTGTLYDAAGANGTSALGYDGWRQATKPSLAHDLNLGTGSDETASGPKFVDPSRNLATFDPAYLGNSATAWADSHAYSVGDMASTANVGFYAGATVNFRCVKAHTSAAANATNGQPGGTTATSYRTNWEFAGAYRLRAAIAAGTTFTDAGLGLSGADAISTILAWVRAGFAPRNTVLKNAGHDAVTIGAVEGAWIAGPPKGTMAMMGMGV